MGPTRTIARQRTKRLGQGCLSKVLFVLAATAVLGLLGAELCPDQLAFARTKIQSGTVSAITLTNPIEVTLAENVDKSKSIILFSFYTTTTTPALQSFAARFKAGVDNVIQFQRNTGSTAVRQQINYSVIESDAFEVEYREDAIGAGVCAPAAINLAGTVDFTLGKTFVISRCTNINNTTAANIIQTFFTANLNYNTAPTVDQLVLKRYDTAGTTETACEVWSFIVKLKDDSTVQEGLVAGGSTDFMISGDLATAVDRSKSFLIFGLNNSAADCDQQIRGSIVSDVSVGFNKRGAGGTSEVYYYCVELGTLGFVENGEGTMPNTAGDAYSSKNFSLANQYDTDWRFGIVSADATNNQAAPDRFRVAVEFTGNSTLTTAKGDSSYVSVVDYFAGQLEPMKLFSPNGGVSQVLKCGEQQDISWYAPAGVSQVNIYLSNNGGASYDIPLATGVANNPSGSTTYNWTPSAADGAIIGNQIRIKVVDKAYIDGGGTANAAACKYSSDASDANFEIIAKIDQTYPAGGEQITFGDALNIAWTFYGPVGSRTVAIKYDTNSGDGGYGNTIATGLAPAGSPHSLNWTTTPLPLSNTLRIKVEQVGEESRVKDASNSNFTVKGAIVLGAPTGGETWKIGELKDIVWVAKGASYMTSGVDIKVSRNAGGSWSTITTKAADYLYNTKYANQSYYEWTVEAPGSSEALIKVVSIDYPAATAQSTNLTIQQTVQVNVPVVSGQIWRVGEPKNITYTIQGSVPNIDLHYSILASPDPLNDSHWNSIATTINTTTYPNSYAWPGGVANNISNTCWLRIRDSVNTNIYHVSTYNFKIKGNINISQPIANQLLHYSVSETLAWTVTGSVNGTADIKLSTNGTTYDYTIGTKAIAGAGGYTFAWTPNDPLHLGVACKLQVVMQGDSDTQGVTADSFKVRPNIALTYPKSQTGVEVNVDDPADKLYIKWTPSPENFGTVNIRYDLDNGAGNYPDSNIVVSNYASNTKPNAVDIGYEWQVPDSPGMVTNKMRVMVYKTGEAVRTDVSDTSDASFTILGTLTLTGASNGSGTPEELLWKIGTNKTITWTAKGDITPVNIYYSLDNGGSWNDLVIGYAAGSGNRQCNDIWNPIPDDVLSSVPGSIRETDVKFRITNTSQSIENISTGNITIQARIILQKPTGQSTVLTVVDPADDPASYTENQIAWTYNGDGLDTVQIVYDTQGGGGGYGGIVENSVSASAGAWDLWQVPDIVGDNVKVRVRAPGANGDYVYGESAESFNVKGQIKIIAPDPLINGATVWKVDRAAADAAFASVKNLQYKCF
ncbi:MAG: hypothetical protein HY810_03635 [Candidatus Omnitrophica bacterium]|nr:hypothetical protein [Candidatus Omnitrophota bacterium]